MKRSILAIALLCAAVAFSTQLSKAQVYGGAVLDHDIMMPSDFATLSQNNAFGTSRSMAMGGAFTSLGGDLASVTINPAGLGMFSHDVVSLTPMLSTAKAINTSVPSWNGNNDTSFAFANIGASFNLAQKGSGSLISLTGAITYSRLADYNTKNSFQSETLRSSTGSDLVPSINDVFMQQLDGADIYPASDGGMNYDRDPRFWSAQGAYKTLMLDPLVDNGQWAGWTTNVIGDGASILSLYDVEQQGRTDEYSFALGGNVGNYLYFGATFGIQEISQTTQYLYEEQYNYYDTTPMDLEAVYNNIWQETKLSGAGTNLKLGLIARPTRGLRIGVAYHSPTYYSLARTYQTYTESRIINHIENTDKTIYTPDIPLFVDNYENSWRFRTPSKFLAGVSYQLGSFGVVSVDYERQWYNWIRVTNTPTPIDITPYGYKCNFEDSYKPVNTLRAGIEVKPLPIVSLRAGGGASSSMLVNESLNYSAPTPTNNYYLTLGVGVQFSKVTSLDIAYQHFHQNYSSYRLFYVGDEFGFSSASKLFDTSLKRNFISATLSFRL